MSPVYSVTHLSIRANIQQRKIQAEGTAYVVARHFGLANKSCNYLALYDADYRKTVENCKAISEASRTIIGYMSEHDL